MGSRQLGIADRQHGVAVPCGAEPAIRILVPTVRPVSGCPARRQINPNRPVASFLLRSCFTMATSGRTARRAFPAISHHRSGRRHTRRTEVTECFFSRQPFSRLPRHSVAAQHYCHPRPPLNASGLRKSGSDHCARHFSRCRWVSDHCSWQLADHSPAISGSGSLLLPDYVLTRADAHERHGLPSTAACRLLWRYSKCN